MTKFQDKYKNPICNLIQVPNSPELESLYKERDEKFKEYTEVQKKIDNLILEKAIGEMGDVVGQYVKISSKSLDEDYWMFVKRMERLYNGVRLIGPMLDVYCEPDTNCIVGRIDEEGHSVIKQDEFDSVKIISKEDFMSKWNTFIETFNKSLIA